MKKAKGKKKVRKGLLWGNVALLKKGSISPTLKGARTNPAKTGNGGKVLLNLAARPERVIGKKTNSGKRTENLRGP